MKNIYKWLFLFFFLLFSSCGAVSDKVIGEDEEGNNNNSIGISGIHEEIGYIKINNFLDKDFIIFFKDKISYLEEEEIKALVIDLRGNSGGYLSNALNLADLFLEKEKIIVIQEKVNGDEVYQKALIDKIYGYELVLLTDNYTRSAAEAFVAGLKCNNRAYVIGTETYGKGYTEIIVDGKKQLNSIVYTPNKEPINNKIYPNKYIENPFKFQDYGQDDNQFQEAIKYLLTPSPTERKAIPDK